MVILKKLKLLLTKTKRDAARMSCQRDFDSARPLAFMHVPKTSGSSLTAALAKAFPQVPALLDGFDRSGFGAFSDFDSFCPALRNRMFDAPASLPTASMLVSGHFSLMTLKEAYPAAQLMTILREPISRLLSSWMFLRQHTDAQLEGFGSWANFVREGRKPLAEFLSIGALGPGLDNGVLRTLLWPHPLIPSDGFINPEHDEVLVAAAMEKLNAFSFVDIIENPKMIENLQLWLRRAISYPRENVTLHIPPELRTPFHKELNETAHNLLVSHSRLDLQLWTAVATQKLGTQQVRFVGERAKILNVARYSALMAA